MYYLEIIKKYIQNKKKVCNFIKYNLVFKYRIYLNEEQKLMINRSFECISFVYSIVTNKKSKKILK